MKMPLQVLGACLLACLLLPPGVRAGGDLELGPFDIGEKLLAKKHFKTALKYFRKALEQDDARGHYGLGLLHEATGREQDAAGEYRRFLDRGQPGPQRSDASWRLAAIEERREAEAARSSDLLERGRSLLKNGKYREAEKALLQAAAREPSNAEVHFSLGDVYLALEAYDKAKEEYGKAKKYY